MTDQFEKPIWGRVGLDIDFNLQLMNPDKVDLARLRALLETVIRAEAVPDNFNQEATRKFNDFFDRGDYTLAGRAYTCLSNWFMTDRQVSREGERGVAARELWNALFLVEPRTRLTDRTNSRTIIEHAWEEWWEVQQAAQQGLHRPL